MLAVRTARAARGALRSAASRRYSSAPAAPTADQLSAYQQAQVTPWAVFGAGDMGLMLLSADFIDAKIAPALGISALCATAWGNTFGLLLGVFTMRQIPKPDSTMTVEQLGGSAAKNAKLIGSLIGLAMGMVVGMIPLLWQYFGFVRLWTPGKSAEYAEQMKRAGVDTNEFARRLIAHLQQNESGAKFSNLSQAAFAELVQKAVPCKVGKVGAIFAAMDAGGKGYLDYDDFFRAMVCGQADKIEKVTWTAKAYAIHQSMVDKDHQRLFELINDVIKAMKSGTVGGVEEALRGLRGYTVYHFNNEIDLLGTCATYPADELAAHKVKHANFVAKVSEFESKFQTQELAAVCELCSGEMLNFLNTWLVQHIQGTDTKCTEHYKKAGVGSTQYL